MNDDPSKPPRQLPGKGLLGWLGRQVAYVRHALKSDVSASKTIYRDCTIEEKPLPQDPNVVLRRTVIDEVVVDRAPPPPDEGANRRNAS
ncbi:MAG: hypothetical protein ABSB33_03210 [Tepidisphaeraceae bacterium]|jgi:hypothetical protein